VFLSRSIGACSEKSFAYVTVEPASASPGFLLCRALEQEGGNPHVALAASDYGALLVIFATAEDREATLLHFPDTCDGHTISLEKPEVAGNRAAWTSLRFALLSATGFPPELWDEESIRAAFCPIGSVCCVDPLCLRELDYSAWW
jgi:hypothetical protein